MNIPFRLLFFSLLLGTMVSFSDSQVLTDSSCPLIQPMRKFSPEKFLGTWYELERFYSDMQVNTKCNKIELEKQNGRITVLMGGIHERTGLPHRLSHGMATFDYADPARLTLSLRTPTGGGESVFDYWVLDTDYESYAVIYNCEEVCGGRKSAKSASSLWILGRTALLPKGLTKRIHEKLRVYGLDHRKLMGVNQHSCVNLSVSVRSENALSGEKFNRSSARVWLSNLLRRKSTGKYRTGRIVEN